MGREKERSMLPDEPSDKSCHCGGPINYGELYEYYDNGGFCSYCYYQWNKNDQF